MFTLFLIIYISGLYPAYILSKDFEYKYAITNREEPCKWLPFVLAFVWPIAIIVYGLVFVLAYYLNKYKPIK